MVQVLVVGRSRLPRGVEISAPVKNRRSPPALNRPLLKKSRVRLRPVTGLHVPDWGGEKKSLRRRRWRVAGGGGAEREGGGATANNQLRKKTAAPPGPPISAWGIPPLPYRAGSRAYRHSIPAWAPLPPRY